MGGERARKRRICGGKHRCGSPGGAKPKDRPRISASRQTLHGNHAEGAARGRGWIHEMDSRPWLGIAQGRASCDHKRVPLPLLRPFRPFVEEVMHRPHLGVLPQDALHRRLAPLAVGVKVPKMGIKVPHVGPKDQVGQVPHGLQDIRVEHQGPLHADAKVVPEELQVLCAPGDTCR